MADYKLQARIPQELADELFQVIKEVQEKTEVADVTTSSITRAAIEQYIRDYRNEQTNDYLKVYMPIDGYTCNDLDGISKKLHELSDLNKDNKKEALIFAKLALMFTMASSDKLAKKIYESEKGTNK
jgi:predicted transcriptional regulator